MRDKLIEELKKMREECKYARINGDSFNWNYCHTVVEWLEDFLRVNRANEAVDIRVLELTVRAENVLRRAYINTISDLQSHSEEELRAIRNMGSKSLAEIYEKLENYLKGE